MKHIHKTIRTFFSAILIAGFISCMTPSCLTAHAQEAGTAGIVCITAPDTEKQESVLARYNLIPAEIRNAFEVMNWRIEVTDMDTLLAYRGAGAKQYPWYYEIAGTTIPELQLICLNDKASFAEESICHEMGHFFDGTLTPLSGGTRAGKRPEFYIIFNEEKPFIGSLYTGSSSTEFFAECFRYYVEDPVFLQQACPKTYTYIDAEVNAYKAYVQQLSRLQEVSFRTTDIKQAAQTQTAYVAVLQRLIASRMTEIR